MWTTDTEPGVQVQAVLLLNKNWGMRGCGSEVSLCSCEVVKWLGKCREKTVESLREICVRTHTLVEARGNPVGTWHGALCGAWVRRSSSSSSLAMAMWPVLKEREGERSMHSSAVLELNWPALVVAVFSYTFLWFAGGWGEAPLDRNHLRLLSRLLPEATAFQNSGAEGSCLFSTCGVAWWGAIQKLHEVPPSHQV